jgi:uncharacterized membrane protein YsdA (DUF1294 family)/cold shock CspA family protein
MRTKGKITSWNDDRGYGFITPLSGGKQVFIHISAFTNQSRRPATGNIVSYGISSDKRGRPCAVKATLAGDRLQVNKKKSTGSFSNVIPIVFFCILAVLVLSGKLPIIILALYTGLSLLTYFAYALDKSAAKNGRWRTQESTLHLFSLAGGWPGAIIAQQRLRHKSKKVSFRFVFWVTVALNFGGFMWLFSSSGSELRNFLLQSMF